MLPVSACSPSHDGGSDAGASTSLVVGLTTNAPAGVIGAIHVTATVDGAPAADVVVPVLNDPGSLPKEIALAPPPGHADAAVVVRADAFLDAAWTPARTDETPIATRTATTAFVPGQNELLRLSIEQRCFVASAGGSGPTCAAPQTCVEGACADDAVAPSALEPYRAGWATDAPDVCKPLGAGPPVVVVGSGQTDYLPITDGEVLTPELGPQGGHHVWIAVRMHDLKQAGSTTTITGSQPGGASIPPTSFVFTYDQDEGGYCKLFGLRYQLDNGGIDYKQFLGKPLDLQVVVSDQAGAKGVGVAHVTIDSVVKCPDGNPCPM